MPQVSLARGALPPLLGLALAGCAPPNALEGSLGEVVPLGFTKVAATLAPPALSLSYLQPAHGGDDVIFKLVAQLPEDAAAGRPIDLSPAEGGSARALATRAVAEDPVRTFAPILRGTLVLDRRPEVEKPLAGEFRVTFGEGGDAGDGRTVVGRFEIADVEPGE